MGYPPDLPGDDGIENSFNTSNENIINYAQNTSEDSDNEENNPYEGYQQIPFGDAMDQDAESDDADTNTITDQQVSNDPNLPNVISVEAEVEQEVWDKPRPKELEIELDTSKSEQIMAAMAAFTLPNNAIPEWSHGISEEKWKENLLERIRQRKEVLTGCAPSSQN